MRTRFHAIGYALVLAVGIAVGFVAHREATDPQIENAQVTPPRAPSEPAPAPIQIVDVRPTRVTEEPVAKDESADRRAQVDNQREECSECLRRTMEGQKELARRLAGGDGLGQIRDAELRDRISAELRASDERFTSARNSMQVAMRTTVDRKIAAGEYARVGEPRVSKKSVTASSTRHLPDGTQVYVDLELGEAPSFEQAREEWKSILNLRAEQVERLLREAAPSAER